jgi:hypothetical protein
MQSLNPFRRSGRLRRVKRALASEPVLELLANLVWLA